MLSLLGSALGGIVLLLLLRGLTAKGQLSLSPKNPGGGGVGCFGLTMNPTAAAQERRPVVGIVGGGIAGAAVALALQRRNIEYVLLERDESFGARRYACAGCAEPRESPRGAVSVRGERGERGAILDSAELVWESRAGYGVTLQQGVSALRELGLLEEAQKHDIPSSSHYIFSTDGSIVGFFGRVFHASPASQMSDTADPASLPCPRKKYNVHLARQALRGMMMERLRPECVQWGCKLQGLEDAGGGQVRLALEGGGVMTVDLVVGADGVRSVVRRLCGREGTNYLGVMVIMGMSETTHPVFGSVVQMNDGENRLFCMPFQRGVTFWQLSFPLADEAAAKRIGADASSLQREVLARMESWHPIMVGLVRGTSPGDVSGHPVYDADCPPPRQGCSGTGEGAGACADGKRWQIGGGCCSRVVLMGDAAHPMAPFKAQGANQALMDAVRLASVLSGVAEGAERGDWSSVGCALCGALKDYEEEMERRSMVKVLGSRRALSMLHSPCAANTETWVGGRGTCEDTLAALRHMGVGAWSASEPGGLDGVVNATLRRFAVSRGANTSTGSPDDISA